MKPRPEQPQHPGLADRGDLTRAIAEVPQLPTQRSLLHLRFAGSVTPDAVRELIVDQVLPVVGRRGLVAALGDADYALLLQDCGEGCALKVARLLRTRTHTLEPDVDGAPPQISAGIVAVKHGFNNPDWVLERGRRACDAAQEAGVSGIRLERTLPRPAPGLRLTEQECREVLDAAPDALLFVDDDGLIRFSSAQADSLFGFDCGELIGQPVEIVIPTRFHRSHIGKRAGFFRSPQPRPMGAGMALSARHRDGTEFPVEVSLSPVKIDGSPFAVTSVRDVTTRTEALRQSETRSRAILQAIPLQIAVIDRDGRITAVNEAWSRFARENDGSELIGEGVGANYLEVCDRASGSDAEEATTAAYGIRTVLSGGLAEFTLEYPCHSPTEQRWFLMTVTPFEDREGAVVTHLNVTERKRLDAQRASFSRIFEHSINEIYIFDATTLQFLHVNEAARRNLGYGIDELRAMTPLDIEPQLSRDAVEQGVAPLIDGETSQLVFETMHRRKDGSEYAAEVHLQHMRFDGRSVLVAIVLDVTERKAAERELLHSYERLEHRVTERTEQLANARDIAEAATAAKSRFLAAASHDLRQPLQSLGLYLSALTRQLDDDAALQTCRKMRQSLDVMGELLEALLDISKLDSGAITPELREFAIQDLLDQVVADNTPHAQKKGLALRVHAAGYTVRSDAALLQRIVENFVANAIRYTATGKILVGCRRCGDGLRIEVWDTGPGIPAESREAIFEEYFQLDRPARTRGQGLGLGLAIVRHIARLLEHRLEVKSVPGSGSMFSVTVPLVERRPLAQAPERPAPRDKTAGPTPRVLFIDDDAAIIDAISLLLSSEGIEVHTAMDGEEAVAQLGSGLRPDIVVSDFRLPGDDGVQVLRRLREELHRDVPAVIMTGDTSAGKIRDAELPDCTVLHKPVDHERLMRLIWKAAGHRA